MPDNKKETERAELHKTIWSIADNLRGSVDGWDFKNYVLCTMFYRYLSEGFAAYINDGERASGNLDFDYSQMSDEDAAIARDGLIQEQGFFIYPSQLFRNMVEYTHTGDDYKEHLNEKIKAAFDEIENSSKNTASESDFQGLFREYDCNSVKLGANTAKRNEKLKMLLDGISSMNLAYSGNTIDTFGDAYEFLMSMYAANAGKSGGEYFTPAEVSMLLMRLALGGKTHVNKVYDPCCGSGSLLLKAAKMLGPEGVEQGYFGQDINLTNHNLCRINMFLHGIPFNKFNIACEDTLLNPKHWDDQPFEAVVTNMPYSVPWVGDDDATLINDPRFAPAGVLAPKSKADLAFVMHCLAWLAENGTAAIVCFPGIMYRGGAEQKIRKFLVDNNYVDCLIQMSSNMFFGTSIATTILILKRNRKTSDILFIDASKECVKVTNNNKLTDENIDRIYSEFINREEVQYFAHNAKYDDVVANNYNLSVSTYVEAEDTREKVDIVKLNAEISEIVAREQVLRDEIDKIIAEIEG